MLEYLFGSSEALDEAAERAAVQEQNIRYSYGAQIPTAPNSATSSSRKHASGGSKSRRGSTTAGTSQVGRNSGSAILSMQLDPNLSPEERNKQQFLHFLCRFPLDAVTQLRQALKEELKSRSNDIMVTPNSTKSTSNYGNGGTTSSVGASSTSGPYDYQPSSRQSGAMLRGERNSSTSGAMLNFSATTAGVLNGYHDPSAADTSAFMHTAFNDSENLLKKSTAVTDVGQQVEKLKLEELVKCFFPQSEFAAFLGSAFVRDPNFLDLHFRKLPEVNVEALKQLIANYFDLINCDVKIPMVIDFLQLFVLDVRDRPELLLKNLRSVINFEFLTIFHAAGPVLQKVFQQYGGNSPRRDYITDSVYKITQYPEIHSPLTAKLTVEPFDVTQSFAKFKSLLKPMSTVAVRQVLKQAKILKTTTNSHSYSAEEEEMLFNGYDAGQETVILDLSAFHSPSGEPLGEYAMAAVPSYNASIAAGEHAVLITKNKQSAAYNNGGHLVQTSPSLPGRTTSMDEFLEVESDDDSMDLNRKTFPEIFLKIRRPEVYQKLEAERKVLYQVTEELPGARSYLLQSYVDKTLYECDFEQEQMYLELGYEKYNGKGKQKNIVVPRVLARPQGVNGKNGNNNLAINSGYSSMNGNGNSGTNVPGQLSAAPGDPGIV